jgi:membrane protein implicated in regulation of membrane protease activity
LKQAHRQSKPLTDPVTATVCGLLSSVLATGGLYLGFHALATGCIRLMRGRHGPAVTHCAPETSYWVATTISLVLGAALVVVGWKFLHLARSTRSAIAAGR